MDRCAQALEFRKEGYSCAQAVAGAFANRTGLTMEQVMAAAGGFGGGLGGCHAELCGAVSGGVLALGLLYPHTDGADAEGKKRVYARAKEFRRRFEATFGHTRCNELLAAKPGVTDQTAASKRLGVTTHCNNMVVTAVEIVEQMLSEEQR